jgi:CHASE2 domain-containing sensor protein
MGLLSMVVGALVLVTLTELKDKPESLRRLSRMYAAGLLVFSIVSVTYFVWPPTIFLLVSLGLSLFALLRFRKAA